MNFGNKFGVNLPKIRAMTSNIRGNSEFWWENLSGLLQNKRWKDVIKTISQPFQNYYL
jgi:hypothetical protein